MEVGRFSPTTYGRDIRVSPVEPNTLYSALSVAAASKDGGLYRSEDGGDSWQRFDKVQVHGTIMSIGLHPTDAGQVYIGARYDGEVFGTRDAGKTWQGDGRFPARSSTSIRWRADEGRAAEIWSQRDSVISTGAPLEYLGVNSARSEEILFSAICRLLVERRPHHSAPSVLRSRRRILGFAPTSTVR